MVLVISSCKTEKPIVNNEEKPVLISDEFSFTEGPAADAAGNVFFTDQPNNRILKWDAQTNEISVYMENAGRANGMYFDSQGSLLAAADENSELWKIDDDKNHQTLVKDYEGKRLNGPNDIWVDGNGGIYFTDPYYQRDYWERKEPEITEQRVYYLSPYKKLSVAAEGLVQPNGIIGSSKDRKLYIADIGDSKTYSYDIAEDGTLRNKKLFTEMGSDGMTIDENGNVYLTGKGLTVFNPKGEKVKHIPIERDWTANVTFGGKDRNKLFITASNSVFVLDMKVKGMK
ncbi:Gluconolactonase [Christiangramia flava JLT2011]|uniref:Gluconolactonase n=1 Tax=Christiangramia flava JLT2011 TaxID=1229726 RepID=A0A1L7I7S5_9FLAO|nr:Gluconolactonase [Christiangramia flava JLT2011]OSS39320.1 Gluconolactonase [Christiangramia flava JLT2011]